LILSCTVSEIFRVRVDGKEQEVDWPGGWALDPQAAEFSRQAEYFQH